MCYCRYNGPWEIQLPLILSVSLSLSAPLLFFSTFRAFRACKKQKALVLFLGSALSLFLDAAILAGVFGIRTQCCSQLSAIIRFFHMMKLNSPVRERRVSHGLSRQQDCPAARAEQRNDEQLSVNEMWWRICNTRGKQEVFRVNSERKCVFLSSYLHSSGDVLIWNFAASFGTKPPGKATSAQKTSNYT